MTSTTASPRAGALANVESKSATESRPPNRPTATVARRGTCNASALSTAVATRAAPSCRATRPPSSEPPASAGDHLLEFAITEDFVLARIEKRIERLILKIAQHLDERFFERHHHRGMIAMRAAQRLVHHLVDQTELLQTRGGDPEGFCSFRRMLGGFPEDRRATLGRNDRVRCVLQHQRDVADGDRERAAWTAFANDGDDDRNPQTGHFVQIASDCFRLPSLLGVDSRVRARRVDEREQR